MGASDAGLAGTKKLTHDAGRPRIADGAALMTSDLAKRIALTIGALLRGH
jgi:hypothetical protein